MGAAGRSGAFTVGVAAGATEPSRSCSPGWGRAGAAIRAEAARPAAPLMALVAEPPAAAHPGEPAGAALVAEPPAAFTAEPADAAHSGAAWPVAAARPAAG